jgi:hypothetical protein
MPDQKARGYEITGMLCVGKDNALPGHIIFPIFHFGTVKCPAGVLTSCLQRTI